MSVELHPLISHPPDVLAGLRERPAGTPLKILAENPLVKRDLSPQEHLNEIVDHIKALWILTFNRPCELPKTITLWAICECEDKIYDENLQIVQTLWEETWRGWAKKVFLMRGFEGIEEAFAEKEFCEEFAGRCTLIHPQIVPYLGRARWDYLFRGSLFPDSVSPVKTLLFLQCLERVRDQVKIEDILWCLERLFPKSSLWNGETSAHNLATLTLLQMAEGLPVDRDRWMQIFFQFLCCEGILDKELLERQFRRQL